ncbi:uncharacterized protein LOC122060643 [Macadamia integrifolia]|uniref:uncharacterized protein LOC122060643 n=1 Tax=Macadamia integrifolia TaxID=60698 RepID=UPI001C5325BF|nr:uncharacterized protein LOC122060643 [Macadamia integrifolia]
MIRSWLVHSCITSISNSILWIDTTRDVWVDLHERFSKKNASRIFEIQGLDSISTYYTISKAYRDELSSYRTLPSCQFGAMTTLTALLETYALVDFLQGLYDSYVAVSPELNAELRRMHQSLLEVVVEKERENDALKRQVSSYRWDIAHLWRDSSSPGVTMLVFKFHFLNVSSKELMTYSAVITSKEKM